MHTFLKYGVLTLAIMFTFANVSALTRKQKFGFLDILLMSVTISLYILMQFELGF